jgi:putative transposase
MRPVELNVPGNHLHLTVEADDSRSMSRGMQGLCIRIAKALNSLMNMREEFSSALPRCARC